MAEQNQDFLSACLKQSRETAFKRVSQSVLGGIQSLGGVFSRPFNAHSSDNTQLVELIWKEADSDVKRIFDGDANKKILKSLDNKQLNSIYKLVLLHNEFRRLGIEEGKGSIYKEYAQNCLDAISNFKSTYRANAIVKDFSNEKLDKLIKEIEKGGYFEGVAPQSNADLELVTAFGMMGVDLKFNGKEWEIENLSDQSQFKFSQGREVKGIAFSRDEVQSLLTNYLNKPIEERGNKVITPDGLFKVYVERATTVVDRLPLQDTEKKLMKTDIISQQRKFSTKSEEWLIESLLDKENILRMAQVTALNYVFGDVATELNIANLPDGFSDDFINSVKTSDPAYTKGYKIKGRSVRFDEQLKVLENKADDIIDIIEDNHVTSNLTYNYINLYDEMIERLEPRNSDPKIQEYISKLIQAKENLIANVDFQRAYLDNYALVEANGSPNVAKFTRTVKEARNCAVTYDNGVIKMMGTKDMDSKLATELLKRVQEKVATNKASQPTKESEQPVNSDTESVTEESVLENQIEYYPDIFADIFSIISITSKEAGEEFWNALNNQKKLEVASCLLKEGELLRVAYDEFMNKPENKGKTIEDFAKSYGSGYFDSQTIIDAFEMSDPAKQNDKNAGFAKKQDAFNKQLVILDLASSYFTPEEYAQYTDSSTSENIRQTLLSGKLAKALDKYSKMSPEEIQKYASDAIKRHKNRTLARLISEDMPSFEDIEKEPGKEHLGMTKALDKYMQKLKEEQNLNDNQLLESMKPIVNENNKELDKSNENAEKDPTLGQLYPSGPNVTLYLKKMKPYSGKDLVKHFLEPLLADLEGIRINRKAMEERQAIAAGKGATPIANNPNSENNANADAELQQPENDAQQSQNDVQQPTQEEKPKITKRDFEAAMFANGKNMLEAMPQETKNQPYGIMLDRLFDLLSSTDEKNSPGFEKDEYGNDIRDDLREVAMNICRADGRYKEDPQNIQRDLGAILKARNITQGSQLYTAITEGFKFVTPEVLDYMFATSSEVDMKANPPVLKLGTSLSKETIRELSNCTDEQRRTVIAVFNGTQKNKNNNFMDQASGLSMLFDDIYTKAGKIDFEAIKNGYNKIQYGDIDYNMDM